jgi:2-keto-3-deoxy-L-rhamnonate aldolase RhmA
MAGTFKEKIAQGDLLVGTIITLPSAEVAEIFSLSGIDCLFVGP